MTNGTTPCGNWKRDPKKSGIFAKPSIIMVNNTIEFTNTGKANAFESAHTLTINWKHFTH